MEFIRLVGLYLPLSAEENGWLERIDGSFEAAVTAGIRTMTATDGLLARLDDFDRQFKTMEPVLHELMRPLMRCSTSSNASCTNATRSSG